MKMYQLIFLFILVTACAVKPEPVKSPGYTFGQTVKVTKGFYKGCEGDVTGENSDSYTLSATCWIKGGESFYAALPLTIPFDSLEAVSQ